ncbi:MFS transporter [Candidatus Woesearchaeota archaeon]|nr:MFS transporter [Candidatus Woesearchaeota archaeon]
MNAAIEKKENKFKAMFSSLKYRNFRLLWTGAVISSTGDFLEIVALNWLVYEMTNSPFYLGLFNLARSLPILFFTLIAGALADKYERRKLMLYSQSTAMLLSFVLAFLAFSGKLTVYPLISIGILQGIANSFNLPIRQSLISELVPREALVNAVALNGASLTLTLVLGPALGGLIVGTLGIKYALLLNAVSFLAVIWALYIMKIPRQMKDHKKSLTQSIKEGAVYVFNHKIIFTVALFSFLMVAVGLPYTTLLPVFAKDYFHIGAKGYGYMFSIAGIGALVGSLFSGVRSKEKVKKAMIFSFISFGFLLVFFGIAAIYLSNYLFIFIILLVMLGFSFSTFNATNNTILQLMTDDVYRGRVLSTLFLGFGLTSLGNFIIGWLAEFLSAPIAYILIGSTLLVLSLFLVYYTKEHKMHT